MQIRRINNATTTGLSPELHLLTEGQVISALHHDFHQLAQFGFDLNGVDHVAQDAHVPADVETDWETFAFRAIS